LDLTLEILQNLYGGCYPIEIWRFGCYPIEIWRFFSKGNRRFFFPIGFKSYEIPSHLLVACGGLSS
jgi:hypothetical protein